MKRTAVIVLDVSIWYNKVVFFLSLLCGRGCWKEADIHTGGVIMSVSIITTDTPKQYIRTTTANMKYRIPSTPILLYIQRAMCLCYTIYRSMMSFFWCRGHVKGCVVLRVRRAGKRTGSVTALALERCGRGDVPSCSPFAHVVLLTEDPRD